MKHAFSSKLRRLLALALALVLVVGLTGCFQKDDPQPSEEPSIPVQTDPVPETPTDAPTEAPTDPIVIDPADEIVKGIVSANNLNVRSNPSTDSTVLSQLPVDLEIEILEQKTISDTRWGRIGEMTLPNGTMINGGWINLHYVKIAGEEEPAPTEPTTGNEGTGNGSDTVIAKGTVTASELNIRKAAGANNDSVGKYIKGDTVEILEKKTVDGKTWGRTNKGWISLNYVKLDGSTESNNSNNETNPDAEIESDGKTKVLGYGVVDLGSLNVRSGPGTKYDKVGTVSNGARYAYYQKSGNWVRIEKGWVSVSYFYLEGTTADDAVTGTVTSNLNVRTGPGTDYKSNGSYKEGDEVKILAQVNGWGYTSKGWISMKYVKTAAPTYAAGKGTVTTDLNIRKEGNADAEKVGSYKEGDKVTITEVKDGWGKTDKGWISMKYVKMDSASTETGTNTSFKTGKATVKVNTTLTIRKEAKADAEKVGSYNNGDKVTISKVNGEWGQTDKGWINLRYVVFE